MISHPVLGLILARQNGVRAVFSRSWLRLSDSMNVNYAIHFRSPFTREFF